MRLTRRTLMESAASILAMSILPKQMLAQSAQSLGPIVWTPAGDPEFEGSVEQILPGLTQAPMFAATKSSLAIVQNGDVNRGLKAISIYWPQVPVIPQKSLAVLVSPGPLPWGRAALMTAQFNVMGPQSIGLLSPIGLIPLRSSPTSILATVGEIGERLGWASSLINTKIGNASPPMIDAAVFDDWTLVGPDSFGIKDILETARNGQHDEGVFVSRLLAKKAGNVSVISGLTQHLTLPSRATASHRAFLYWTARQSEAQRMLALANVTGAASIATRAQELSAWRRTVISALPV